MEVNSLSVKASSGSQTVEYFEVVAAKTASTEHRLRIHIRSDTYRSQSFAQIERWSGEKWQELAVIHYGAMKTEIGLSYKPAESGTDPKNFQADRDELLRQAALVLE